MLKKDNHGDREALIADILRTLKSAERENRLDFSMIEAAPVFASETFVPSAAPVKAAAHDDGDSFPDHLEIAEVSRAFAAVSQSLFSSAEGEAYHHAGNAGVDRFAIVGGSGDLAGPLDGAPFTG